MKMRHFSPVKIFTIKEIEDRFSTEMIRRRGQCFARSALFPRMSKGVFLENIRSPQYSQARIKWARWKALISQTNLQPPVLTSVDSIENWFLKKSSVPPYCILFKKPHFKTDICEAPTVIMRFCGTSPTVPGVIFEYVHPFAAFCTFLAFGFIKRKAVTFMWSWINGDRSIVSMS